MHLAAAGGHISTIKYLGPKMQNQLHSIDNSGATVLHWAALGGHAEVVRYVIDKLKLDPTACDKVSVVYVQICALKLYIVASMSVVQWCYIVRIGNAWGEYNS